MVYAIKWQNPENLSDFHTEFYYPKELKYHSDWNWLIPAIEHIKALGICYGDEGYNLIECIDNYLIECCIASTHAAVVQFFEWYNKQNK